MEYRHMIVSEFLTGKSHARYVTNNMDTLTALALEYRLGEFQKTFGHGHLVMHRFDYGTITTIREYSGADIEY